MNSSFFLWTGLLLFIVGAIGTFLNRRNFIIMLLCIELMLLSANFLFLSGSCVNDDCGGIVMALMVMTAAAAETALGLALCVLHVRLRSTLDVELINLLKG
jgi:NADH-quinone oxidoreductase subunit K